MEVITQLLLNLAVWTGKLAIHRWYFNLTFLIQLWIACNHCVVWAILELFWYLLPFDNFYTASVHTVSSHFTAIVLQLTCFCKSQVSLYGYMYVTSEVLLSFSFSFFLSTYMYIALAVQCSYNSAEKKHCHVVTKAINSSPLRNSPMLHVKPIAITQSNRKYGNVFKRLLGDWCIREHSRYGIGCPSIQVLDTQAQSYAYFWKWWVCQGYKSQVHIFNDFTQHMSMNVARVQTWVQTWDKLSLHMVYVFNHSSTHSTIHSSAHSTVYSIGEMEIAYI